MNERNKYSSFIKNPLGIIALSLIIVEAIAALVIQFSTLTDFQNTLIISFIIIFPFFVMVIFYNLVAKHHTKLYAPKDYVDEQHFVNLFEYSRTENKYIKKEVKIDEISKNPEKKNLDILELKNNEISQSALSRKMSNYKIIINSLKSESVISELNKNGFKASKYEDMDKNILDENHEAIWLGSNIDFSYAKSVIQIAKKYLPHLKYISKSGDFIDPPNYVHDQIFLGGSSDTAVNRDGISPFTEDDFKVLFNSKNAEEFNKIIYNKYPSNYSPLSEW